MDKVDGIICAENMQLCCFAVFLLVTDKQGLSIQRVKNLCHMYKNCCRPVLQ